jgi:60 kDa SS-A/Ro ribonucleoprotein
MPIKKVSTGVADTHNKAGGVAYSLSGEQALAQMLHTATLRGNTGGEGDEKTKIILDLSKNVSPHFMAQATLVAKHKGLMKDAPALLLAALMVRDGELFARVFPKVAGTDLKLVRNFMAFVRSGVVGTRSFGTRPRRLIREFLERLTPAQLFRQSIGTNPSLADVIKMVHPRDAAKQDMYGHIIGNKVVYNESEMTTRVVGKKNVNVKQTVLFQKLPLLIRQYETYKGNPIGNVMPSVPFEMLTALATTDGQWKEIAEKATWKQTIKNIVSFERHSVFSTKKMVDLVATRIRDPKQIRNAKAFPYQLLMAHDMAENNTAVPREIVKAISDAMVIACENIPSLIGNVYVFVDVSGSMNNSVTGQRKDATSKVSCRMVASLIASCIAKVNPQAVIMPFSDRLYPEFKFNPELPLVETTTLLRKLPSGGTDCHLPLEGLNKAGVSHGGEPVTCIFVSDNESYLGPQSYGYTGTMKEWLAFKTRNVNAKLVCLDLVPNITTQAVGTQDVLNVGGWSDANYSTIDSFIKDEYNVNHWVSEIKSAEISSSDVGTSMSLSLESED